MNKKLLTIVAVVLLISTSVVAMVPCSEAKSMQKEFENRNIYNQNYMYYDAVIMERPFKISTGTYGGGFLLFEGSPTKETEVRNALENGNIYGVSGLIVKIDERIEAGSYVMVCNNSWITYQEQYGGQWQDGSVKIDKKVDVTTQYLSVQMSAGKGDSVKITIDAKDAGGLGAYVVTKALKNGIGNYNIPVLTIKNNMSQVLNYKEEIDGKCTLEFTSDSVNDYYLMIVINDSNSRVIHNFDGTINVSGLSETVNPMPFAIVIFIISIGLLAGVIYLGRKKIIE